MTNQYQISNVKIIGCIANFYKTKGLEHLIKAMHILNQNYKLQTTNYKLVIIGDGRLRPKLEALIKKYNLQDTIILTGRKTNAYQYLKAFDIFVLPSVKEGFPWALLEAMAAKIPIISTNVGAVPEIIEDNKHGLLIDIKNSQDLAMQLAEKILWLINHPEQAQQMASNAHQKLTTQFTLQKMLEKTEHTLRAKT